MKWMVFTVVAALSSNSFALGDKEKGAIIGITSTLILQEILNRRGPMVYPQDRYGGEFPPFRCTGSEVECAYELGVYERKREEWEDMKRQAYECGRYGRNCK